MKIYIDFDGTLFNTDKFYQDYLTILNKYNISSFEIEKMKKELFKNKRFNLDILIDYIIGKYNIKNLKQEVETLYNNSYVFEDVIPFLEKYKNYNLILLTLGDIDYQNRKIDGSMLSKYFKDIIITDVDKSQLDIDYKDNLFIDNNPKELIRFQNKGGKIIRIRRIDDKYSVIDLDNVLEYKNFFDLKLEEII